jgi:hypothetical protein
MISQNPVRGDVVLPSGASGAFLTDEQQGTGVVRNDESVSY